MITSSPHDVATDNAQQDQKMTELIAVQRIAQWEKLKALVLDSVSSPITKRVYNMALNEFMDWFQQAPRPGFTKATVSAWRGSLEARGLRSSSIIIRMATVRKLGGRSAHNRLSARADADMGKSRTRCVDGARRCGHWSRVPSRKSRGLRHRRAPRREGHLANAPAVRGRGRCSRHRAS